MAVALENITEEQVQFFQSNGYIKIENALSRAELNDFRQALAAVTDQPGQGHLHQVGNKYTQDVNVWTVHEGVRRHVFNPKLAEIARRLSRSKRIRIWHDQLIVKMPGNRPTQYHHDLPLWPMIEAGALTCWIALVDVTVDMGCMRFIPGSHQWGRLAFATLPNETLENQDGLRMVVPEDKYDALESVTVELKAGSCTFHNALTIHHTGSNLTDRPRMGFIINYMPDGTRYSGKPHVTTDPLGLAIGQPLSGELFPILASVDQSEVAAL